MNSNPSENPQSETPPSQEAPATSNTPQGDAGVDPAAESGDQSATPAETPEETATQSQAPGAQAVAGEQPTAAQTIEKETVEDVEERYPGAPKATKVDLPVDPDGKVFFGYTSEALRRCTPRVTSGAINDLLVHAGSNESTVRMLSKLIPRVMRHDQYPKVNARVLGDCMQGDEQKQFDGIGLKEPELVEVVSQLAPEVGQICQERKTQE